MARDRFTVLPAEEWGTGSTEMDASITSPVFNRHCILRSENQSKARFWPVLFIYKMVTRANMASNLDFHLSRVRVYVCECVCVCV